MRSPHSNAVGNMCSCVKFMQIPKSTPRYCSIILLIEASIKNFFERVNVQVCKWLRAISFSCTAQQHRRLNFLFWLVVSLNLHPFALFFVQMIRCFPSAPLWEKNLCLLIWTDFLRKSGLSDNALSVLLPLQGPLNRLPRFYSLWRDEVSAYYVLKSLMKLQLDGETLLRK